MRPGSEGDAMGEIEKNWTTVSRETLRQGARLVRLRDGMTGAAYDVEATQYGPRLLLVMEDRALAQLPLWDTASLRAYDFTAGTVGDWRDWLHEAKTAEEIAGIEKEMRAAAREQQRASWVEQWGGILEPLAKGYHGPAVVASNIRRHLAHVFPSFKFSVTSEGGGGSSVRVRWSNGPTVAEVERVVNLYELGRFDGMDDSYKSSGALWPEVFGGVRYVFPDREASERDMERLVLSYCAACGIEPEPFAQWWDIPAQDPVGRNDTAAQEVRRVLGVFSMPAGVVPCGLERDGAGWRVLTEVAPGPVPLAGWTVEVRSTRRGSRTVATNAAGRTVEFSERLGKGEAIRRAVGVLTREDECGRVIPGAVYKLWRGSWQVSQDARWAQQWTEAQPHELAGWEAAAIEAAFA